MKVDNSNRTLFLYTLRIIFFLVLAFGLMGGLALLVKGEISWFFFIPGYALLSFVTYRLYIKALQFDPDEKRQPKKRRTADDIVDPDAEEYRRKMATKSGGWIFFGLSVGLIARIVQQIASAQFAQWIRGNYVSILITIGIIILALVAVSMVVSKIRRNRIVDAVITGLVSVVIIVAIVWIGLIWKPWEQWHSWKWNTSSPTATAVIGVPASTTVASQPQTIQVVNRQPERIVRYWHNEEAGYDTHWFINRYMVPGQWHLYYNANVRRKFEMIHPSDYDAILYFREPDSKDTIGTITFDPNTGVPRFTPTPQFSNYNADYEWTTSKLVDVRITVKEDN